MVRAGPSGVHGSLQIEATGRPALWPAPYLSSFQARSQVLSEGANFSEKGSWEQPSAQHFACRYPSGGQTQGHVLVLSTNSPRACDREHSDPSLYLGEEGSRKVTGKKSGTSCTPVPWTARGPSSGRMGAVCSLSRVWHCFPSRALGNQEHSPRGGPAGSQGPSCESWRALPVGTGLWGCGSSRTGEDPTSCYPGRRRAGLPPRAGPKPKPHSGAWPSGRALGPRGPPGCNHSSSGPGPCGQAALPGHSLATVVLGLHKTLGHLAHARHSQKVGWQQGRRPSRLGCLWRPPCLLNSGQGQLAGAWWCPQQWWEHAVGRDRCWGLALPQP